MVELLSDQERKNLKYLHNSLIENNEYKGMRVSYGPILYNPKYLIVGINPGSNDIDMINFYQRTGEKYFPSTSDQDSLPTLHFLNHPENSLTFLIDVFKSAGKIDDLNSNTMQINCHFVATQGTKKLDTLIRDMDKCIKKKYPTYGSEPYKEFQGKILWNMIERISPKYILCAGKKAYDSLRPLADNARIGIKYNKLKSKWKETEFYFNGKIFLALEIKRNRFSGIDDLDKSMAIEWLRNH